MYKFCFLLLIAHLLVCCNAQEPEKIKDQNREELPNSQETCICPIEKLDMYVRNLDDKTKVFLDTFSVHGMVEVEIAKLSKLGAGVDGEYIINKGKAITQEYLGVSDYSDNPLIIELAIVRNLFCATGVMYCEQGKIDLMEKEMLEFKDYMLSKLRENPPPKEEVIKRRIAKLKVIHGANHKRITIDGNEPFEIPGESNIDYKTYSLPVGYHLVRIDYHSGRSKEKKINLQVDETINHISF